MSATPAANSSLAQAPSQLVLVFSEAIDAANSFVQLRDLNNQVIPGTGSLKLSQGDRAVRVSLPRLQPATYVVDYQVTSASDGHVTAGQYAFLVDPTRTLPPPTGSAQASSPSADPTTIAARWLGLVLTLCLVGLALFWLASARPALAIAHAQASAGGMPMWGTLALLAFLAFTALGLFLQLAAGAAGAHAEGLPLDFAAPFGSTPFAMAMRLMLGGLGAVFVLATARFFLLDEARRAGSRNDRWERPFLVAAVALGLAALAGASLAGHASAYGGLLSAATDWLHLVGVTAWLGTLTGLGFLAGQLRRHAQRRAVLAEALRRHSRIALVAAPIVALTGIANSPLVVGSPRAIVATDYGNLVVAKAVLFSAAVAIGSANFFLVARRAVSRVGLLVGGEAVLGVVASVAAATMLGIQPAASRPDVLSQTTLQTAHLFATAGTSTIHLVIDLPAPGEHLYQVAISDTATGAARTDVKAVTLVFTPPAGGDNPRNAPMAPTVDPTIWAARGDFTPTVGDWTVRVVVRRPQGEESAAFPLSIDQPLPARPVPQASSGIDVPAPIALLWLALPSGVLGWAAIAAGLLIVAAIAIMQRGQVRARGRRALAAARLTAVALVVLAGIGVGSHALVDAAGAPPLSSAALANPLQPTITSVARGERIYRANCSSCHGLDGAGDGPQAATTLPAPGAIGPFVSSQTDGGLYYSITNGLPGTQMPAFSAQLSENDRWDLVNYLRTRWGH